MRSKKHEIKGTSILAPASALALLVPFPFRYVLTYCRLLPEEGGTFSTLAYY